MKTFFGILFSILVIYVIYFDLNHGTLPVAKGENTTTETSTEKTDQPFFEYKVRPGDTVLSIVERQKQGAISVPITKLVQDFKALNKGLEPNNIQIGKIYKFPKYE